MNYLQRWRRRYRILRAMAEDAREIEANFPFVVHAGIGINVVHWGYVEHQLDLLIAWHIDTRIEPESRSEHPRAISRKLRYLKEMEKDETIAEYDRAKLRKIRLIAADISKRRHDFTHSFMDIPETLADWKFIRFEYEGVNIKAVEKNII